MRISMRLVVVVNGSRSCQELIKFCQNVIIIIQREGEYPTLYYLAIPTLFKDSTMTISTNTLNCNSLLIEMGVGIFQTPSFTSFQFKKFYASAYISTELIIR